jgi:hypothetical protein
MLSAKVVLPKSFIRQVQADRQLSQLDVNALNLVPQVWRSLDLNPIAVSLLRKRLAQLECASVESRCDGGISGAVSNNGM